MISDPHKTRTCHFDILDWTRILETFDKQFVITTIGALVRAHHALLFFQLNGKCFRSQPQISFFTKTVAGRLQIKLEPVILIDCLFVNV